MKAAVAVGDGGVRIAEVAEPLPAKGEALIAVDAFSLNRGDLRLAGSAKEGARLGWDFTGHIVSAARGGEGEGVRVAGLMPRLGAWSAQVAASPDLFAAVAGLTALYVLEEAGPLIGRRVLVTGASGGVGHVACQLAAIGGAEVTGLVRGSSGDALLERLSVASAQPDRLTGDFDVVIDSVGGETLALATGALTAGGLCITIGATAGREVAIDAFAFYQKQRRLKGFGLFPAIAAGRPPRQGLTRLLALVADGRLSIEVGHRGDWNEIAAATALLSDRGFKGKAVMKVSA
jgi:NADPH:quinone reductase-like Zn-dependent oxidoreductase